VEQLHRQDEVQCCVSPPFSSTAGEVSLELRLAVSGTKAVIKTSGIKICPSPHPKPFGASGKIQVIVAEEPKMKRFLVIWEEECVCTCTCV